MRVCLLRCPSAFQEGEEEKEETERDLLRQHQSQEEEEEEEMRTRGGRGNRRRMKVGDAEEEEAEADADVEVEEKVGMLRGFFEHFCQTTSLHGWKFLSSTSRARPFLALGYVGSGRACTCFGSKVGAKIMAYVSQLGSGGAGLHRSGRLLPLQLHQRLLLVGSPDHPGHVKVGRKVHFFFQIFFVSV